MTYAPIAITALSLAWLAALCLGFPPPTVGSSATNGMFRITMPGVSYYGGNSVVRTAVYAQERIEQVIKWMVSLLVGNIAAWIAGGTWEAAAMFVAFGALAYGLQQARPVIRLREYIGHAAEIIHVERYAAAEQPGYRAGEIERMRKGYDGLFAGHDIAAGLRRAEPVARVMLVLIRPAVRRFQT